MTPPWKCLQSQYLARGFYILDRRQGSPFTVIIASGRPMLRPSRLPRLRLRLLRRRRPPSSSRPLPRLLLWLRRRSPPARSRLCRSFSSSRLASPSRRPPAPPAGGSGGGRSRQRTSSDCLRCLLGRRTEVPQFLIKLLHIVSRSPCGVRTSRPWPDTGGM